MSFLHNIYGSQGQLLHVHKSDGITFYDMVSVFDFGQVTTSRSFSPGQTSSSKTRPPQKKATSKHSGGSRILRQGKQKQRLHPGLLSSQDRATAHYGAVMGLKATEDGMYLLSAGFFLFFFL